MGLDPTKNCPYQHINIGVIKQITPSVNPDLHFSLTPFCSIVIKLLGNVVGWSV